MIWPESEKADGIPLESHEALVLALINTLDSIDISEERIRLNSMQMVDKKGRIIYF